MTSDNLAKKKDRETTPAIDRVMARIEAVTESGCWIFMGALNEAGYGIVGLGRKGSPNDRAHRITYRHFVGEIADGLFVCHRCDVPSCCNPDHLFLGTPKENSHDMMRKGRGSKPPRNLHDRGSYRYNAKLTEDMVRTLRRRFDCGETGYAIWKELNALYGMHQAPVYRMLNRKTWRHV